ncbi:MAG: hypothetical protein EHM24_25055 [Acidobacteria bacterium]|nr:MAG: hypothetical protein EHM24_25055 [Acidobacteriota bacterium]
MAAGFRVRPACRTLVLASFALAAGCGSPNPSPTTPTASPSRPVVTLVDVTESIDVTAGYTGTWNWPGQSVTMPAGSGFDNLRFHWHTNQQAPAAFGQLYILDREFLGLPGDLNPSTPGFIARSERVTDGQYAFAATVTLKGGTRYWFYGDTQGTFVYSFDTDTYPGGDLYATGYHSNPFRKSPASGRMVNGTYVPPPPGVFLDANFRLQGSPTGS